MSIPPLAGHVDLGGNHASSDRAGACGQAQGWVPERVPPRRRRPCHRPTPYSRLCLDLVEQTLHNWERQERIERGERAGATSEDREEIARLRADVKRLTTERDLLKRSVAF